MLSFAIACGLFRHTVTIGMNKYQRRKHTRRSIRLKGYDYSRSGAYFITICTIDRTCLFGDIIDCAMVLNKQGTIVADEWCKTPRIRREIELDAWMVMPNHFHGIVILRSGRCRSDRPECKGDRPVAPTGPLPRSLGALIAGFKSAVTKRINELQNTPGAKLWQRNYYEHIVRNENELNQIRRYIVDNPAQWEHDRNFVGATGRSPLHSGNEPWMV